ncbi:MAG: hypothetical protein ABI588_08475, partial [Arenimonas sp.]
QPAVSIAVANVAAGSDLAFIVTPAVAADQRVALLLDETSLALPDRATNSAPTSALSVRIPTDFKPGSYFVRVMVDGAQSDLLLETDAVQPDPLNKRFTGPKVAVT